MSLERIGARRVFETFRHPALPFLFTLSPMLNFHRFNPLRRTVAMLPMLHKRDRTYRGNTAITLLRICLWLIPALFIPIGIFLCVFLGRFLPESASISIALLLTLAATAGIGLFEELLTFQQMIESPNHPKRELVVSTIFFVLLQFVIAPSVCIAAICGYAACAAYGIFH
jgi:hypothetical protein